MHPYFAKPFLVWITLSAFLSGPALVCRYSVRDVGFVNVHGQPWQLRILRPDGVDEQDLARWQSIVKAQLAGANVAYEWVNLESSEGQRLVRLFERPGGSSLPVAAIYGPDDVVLPARPPEGADPGDLQELLKFVIDSPVRERILSQITTALCAILIVESGDSVLDRQANETARAAAEQVTRQMWMMDKPTKLGPVVEVVSANEREREQWLLTSLGLDPAAVTPQVVIVYGQGRRLGDPLTGQDIRESEIAQLASLCGQSCECDLDRVWLYGTQMIHRWGEERAATAEESLDFDPAAALVLAEVNGIINRGGTGSKRNDSLIGSGLVIHDFSATDDSSQSARAEQNLAGFVEDDRSTAGNDPPSKELADSNAGADSRDVTNVPNGVPPAESIQVASKPEDQGDLARPVNSRWILLIIVVGIVLCVAVFSMTRGRE